MILTSILPENLPILLLDTETLTLARLDLGEGSPHTLVIDSETAIPVEIQLRFQSFMDTHIHKGSGKNLVVFSRKGSITSLRRIPFFDQTHGQTVAAHDTQTSLTLQWKDAECLQPTHRQGTHVTTDDVLDLAFIIQEKILEMTAGSTSIPISDFLKSKPRQVA